MGLALGAGPALGDDLGPTEDALPSDDAHLTGKDIYSRVAENRFRSYIQNISLFSSDRGGSEQETRLTITWENFREKEDSDPGVLSKTVVRYTHPFEVRYTGYLMLNNLDRANDQFVYLASRRRIRRINLRGENLFGTDFSFEDVVPRELEDRTLYTILAKPVPRHNYLLGKLLGVLLIITAAVVLMDVLFCLVLYFRQSMILSSVAGTGVEMPEASPEAMAEYRERIWGRDHLGCGDPILSQGEGHEHILAGVEVVAYLTCDVLGKGQRVLVGCRLADSLNEVLAGRRYECRS